MSMPRLVSWLLVTFPKYLIHLRLSTVKTEISTLQEHLLAGRSTDPWVVTVIIRRHQDSLQRQIFSSNGWWRNSTIRTSPIVSLTIKQRCHSRTSLYAKGRKVSRIEKWRLWNLFTIQKSSDPSTKQHFSGCKVLPDHNGLEKGRALHILHHRVYHPHKPGKIRVIFDCSAKFMSKSLNDMLYKGSNLTNSLVGVLSRFRADRVAVIADIESMFYWVTVPDCGSSFLRFLWRETATWHVNRKNFKWLAPLWSHFVTSLCKFCAP